MQTVCKLNFKIVRLLQGNVVQCWTAEEKIIAITILKMANGKIVN